VKKVNWEIAGALGEWVGALAVIVTIFYLALQIRTSNRHARAHTEREVLNAWREILGRFTSSPVNIETMQKGLGDYRGLSVTERALFNTMLTAVFDHAESVRRLVDAGLMDPSLYEGTKAVCMSIYNTNGGESWYEAVKEMLIYTPAFEQIKGQAANFPGLDSFLIDERA
jgi:hypothetical protein